MNGASTTRLLILGGTGEAAALARRLVERWPDLEVATSLAGRAGVPALPGMVRVGGFGGAAGLADYLDAHAIDLVVDATHPFAARISAHAVEACAARGVPRLALRRPDWPRLPGDRWVAAASMTEAAAMLPGLGRRAFLTVGAGEAGAFAAVAGVWFLVRLLASAPPPFPVCTVITGRGPFEAEAEEALMRAHRIEVVVAKDSGGDATYGKIAAARALGLPVLMVRRPPPPPGDTADGLDAAEAWIEGRLG